jgi:DNA adenine methylase
MKTLLRYAGGKTKAINKITPFIKDYDKIVSPFIGGGSLEVHWAGNLNKEVIGYDIFDVLVNFWNVLLNNPDELSNKMIEIEPTQLEYNRIKEILMTLDKTQEMLKNWNTNYYKRNDIISLDNITLAAYYYFNHNCSYGPGYLGWPSSVYLKKDKWDKMASNIGNFKCDNLKVKQMSFEDSIRNHSNDFLYLDPPYYLEKDKDNKMFKGMYPMRNIDVHHSGFDHEKLRDLLLNHKGDFVLSYNNCETIRRYYKDFELHYPKWSYSMGNGETRIGKNREKNNNTTKDSHEILIVKKSK